MNQLASLLIAALIIGSSAVSPRKAFHSHNRSVASFSLDQHFYLFNEVIYRTKVQPALRAFKRKNDPKPLIAVVKECIKKFDTGVKMPHLILVTKSDFEDALRKLEQRQRDIGNFIETSIIMVLCMPSDKGVSPELEIGTSPLFMYLLDRSDRMDEFLYLERGESIELIGEGEDRILTKKDIQDFSRLVNEILPPERDERIKGDYNHLRALLKLCEEDPELTLLMTIF